jgi:tetratricopeptide (TPR) repeat protein
MADIELRKSFLGGSIVGHIDTAPGLSWSDHHALLDASRASQQVAAQTTAIRQRLESVDLNVVAVGRAVAAMEYELGFRLENVAKILGRQVAILEDIALALRTPAKTRAAERLVDVAELLRRERWKRALAISQAAIDDDPNNPAGFLAAAWAQMGLGDLESAQEVFIEAADASDGVQRSGSGRQAARLTFAVEHAQAALEMLDRYAITSSPSLPEIPQWEGAHTIKLVNTWWEQQRELAAVHYDRAVYLAATGDLPESALELQEAGAISPVFFAMATTDTQLLKHDELAEPAVSKLADALREQQESIASQAERARALSDEIAEFDGGHLELSTCRQLIEYLDEALVDVYPRDPPRLRLNELLLRHLGEVVRSLEDEDATELQQIIEDAALTLAAKAPDCMARPSFKRTVTVDGQRLQVWEVEQPRHGLMRTSRIWLISTDGVEATVIQLH